MSLLRELVSSPACTMNETGRVFKQCSTVLYASCLDLCSRSPWLLLNLMIIGVDLEEMINDNKQHGSASEKDRERVELGVCNHLECDGASNVAGWLAKWLRDALRSRQQHKSTK
jgi:hypothetical protein